MFDSSLCLCAPLFAFTHSCSLPIPTIFILHEKHNHISSYLLLCTLYTTISIAFYSHFCKHISPMWNGLSTAAAAATLVATADEYTPIGNDLVVCWWNNNCTKNTESGETTEQSKLTRKKNDTHRELRQEICNMNRVWCFHSLACLLVHSHSSVRCFVLPLFPHIDSCFLAFWGYFRVWNIENFHIFFVLWRLPLLCASLAWFFARLFPLSFPISIYYHSQ